MASTPEEMTRHFEQQAQAQREQLDMIVLNKNLSTTPRRCFRNCLRTKKKKLKAKTPSKKSKDKRTEGQSSPFAHTKEKKHSNSKSSKPPSEEGGNLENETLIPK